MGSRCGQVEAVFRGKWYAGQLVESELQAQNGTCPQVPQIEVAFDLDSNGARPPELCSASVGRRKNCGGLGFIMRVVVKIIAPCWVPIIIRHLWFRVPTQTNRNFDNYPCNTSRKACIHK